MRTAAENIVMPKAFAFKIAPSRLTSFSSQWMADMVIIGFFVLVLIGNIEFFQNFENSTKSLMAATVIALGLMSVAFKFSRPCADRDQAHRPKIFFRIAIPALAISTIGLLYSLFFYVELRGDFARYWELAGKYERGEAPNLQSLYHARAWVGLTPFVEIFGYRHLAFKLANALYLFVGFASAGWLAYRFFGVRAAKIALCCSVLCLGPIVWTVFPTHDLPGAAVFMVGIVYIVEVCRWNSNKDKLATPRSIAIFFVASLVMGLLLSWIYFIKSFIPFYLAGGFLGVLIGWPSMSAEKFPTRTKLAVFVIRCVLICMPVIISSLIHISTFDASVRKSVAVSTSDGTHFWIAAHTNSLGTGRYTPDIRYIARPYRPLLNDEEAKSMNLMVANAVDDPFGSLTLRVKKTAQLMTMSTSVGYVSKPEIRISGETKKVINLGPVMAFFGQIFSLLLLSSLVIILLCQKPTRRKAAIIVAPLFVFACALIMLGQVQSRYMMQIWFIGIILIGVAATNLADIRDDVTKHSGAAIKSRILGIGLTFFPTVLIGSVLAAVIIIVTDAMYDFEDGRPVDLRSNATSPLGGKILSPYLVETVSRPLFGASDIISVSLPETLNSQNLVAWTHVELSNSEKDCSVRVQPLAGGKPVGKAATLSHARARRLSFMGRNNVVFEFKKNCKTSDGRDPYTYEIGFIRKIER